MLNYKDIEKWNKQANLFCGSTVVKVHNIFDAKGVVLELAHPKIKSSLFFVFDLDLVRPFFGVFENRLPIRCERKSKPMGVFLKAHLEGMALVAVEQLGEKERKLQFSFSSVGKDLDLMFDLIPHRVNLEVQLAVSTTIDGEKSKKRSKPGLRKMTWRKAKQERSVSTSSADQSLHRVTSFEVPDRSLEDVCKIWLNKFDVQTSQSNSSDLNQIEAKVSKLQKAISKVENEIESKEENHPKKIKKYFTANGSLENSPGWMRKFEVLVKQGRWDQVDLKAHQWEQKLTRTKERKKELIEDLENLKQGNVSGSGRISGGPSKKAPNSQSNHKLKQATKKNQGPVKYRKLEWKIDHWAYLGRNAKDNLQLLRRARPWFIWAHLTDEPSSHLIIEVTKSEVPSFLEWQTLASWLLREGSKRKQDGLQEGEQIEVMWTECRYVRTVKGGAGKVVPSNLKSWIGPYK